MHLPRKIIQYLLHQTLSSVAQYGLCGGLHAQQSSMSSRTLLLVTVGLLALISLASANGKNWALLVAGSRSYGNYRHQVCFAKISVGLSGDPKFSFTTNLCLFCIRKKKKKKLSCCCF